MIYPPILVVGPSGSGKSTCLRHLNPNRTKILNIERKMLPFREGVKFGDNNILMPYQGAPENPALACKNKILEIVKDDTIDVIVYESFTALSDELLKFSKKINKGYDIYNFYADKMIEIIDLIKSVENKWQIVLAIDELVEFMAPNGVRSTSRRCGVNGQKLEGKIEQQFTIVFFTEVRKAPDGKSSVYSFMTNNDGTTSAKSPHGMFKEIYIDNDIMKAIKEACNYWGLKPPIGVGEGGGLEI